MAAASPAAAQQAAEQVDRGTASSTVTILVNGVSKPVDLTGEAVSVFERRDIEQVQGADLTRLLERTPGVSVSRNGGPGAFTGVQVRGADSDHLLVLIDGVRVADPAAPGGGFDLGNLLLGSLARVELQRSSNSTIWGSQAIGGVMAASTGGGPGGWASIEYGAYDTLYATGAGTARFGPATVGVEAGRYSSGGFSAAAGGNEADGFRQTELAGNATLALGGGVSAFARGRYARGRLDIDGFPAPAFTLADTGEIQRTRQLSGVAGLRYDGGGLEVTLDASASRIRRANYDPSQGLAPTYTTDGLEQRAELRGRWRIAPDIALDFGGEREWTRFSTLFGAQRRTAIAGAYAQLDYDHGSLHLAAGGRHDAHADFGGQWSVGGDAAYALSRYWRLTGSYGEGFKAPTLFQLQSDYGNPALRPERGRSYDAGVAYSDGSLHARLTAFRRDTRDLIGFVSCFGSVTGMCIARPFGTYDNIGRARAEGLELEGKADVSRVLDVTAAYTYLEATDRSPGSPEQGKVLSRRPRHALTLSGDWVRRSVRLGADLRVVSNRYEDAANTVPLSAYAVATVRGEWDTGRWLTLYGRVENVRDEGYQTAAGYSTAGRSGYLGARARF